MNFRKRLYDFIYRKTNNRIVANILSKYIYLIYFTNIFIKYKLKYKNNKYKYLEKENYIKILIDKRPFYKYKEYKNSFEYNIKYDLTIIIPVFNVENFIEECILSIINQNTKYSYEIILINDGSTDGSRDILDKYSKFDNIKIINQINSGVSIARNKGIDKAKGRYIMFVDSDDKLTDNTIEILMNEAVKENYDIVEGNYIYINEDGSKETAANTWRNKSHIENNISKSDYILNCMGVPWGKVFKRELWDNVRFPNNMEFEDTLIKVIIYRRAKRYKYINSIIYKYRTNSNSLTATIKNTYKGIDSIWVIIYLIELSSTLKINNESNFYKILLVQFGGLLKSRLSTLNEIELISALIICKDILLKNKSYRPNNLNLIYSSIEKSILDVDLEGWKMWCKII
ncbi:glycosyltransferase [Clostridium perfringens]|nr:glycosyltransferase [Clostridium perfringens]MDM0922925.1 glycosyltransferase [Clostridium perfringens]